MTDHGRPRSERAGDIMSIGSCTVLIGMGERTNPQAVSQMRRRLFRCGGATRVIACQFFPCAPRVQHLDHGVHLFATAISGYGLCRVTDASAAQTLAAGDDAGAAFSSPKVEKKPFFWTVRAKPLGSRRCAAIPTGGDAYESRASNGTTPTNLAVPLSRRGWGGTNERPFLNTFAAPKAESKSSTIPGRNSE